MFESWAIVGPYPSWWLFNFLLLVLQVLHIIWFYLIARIAVKAMLRGKVGHHTDQEMSEKYCDVELNLIHSLSKFFSLSNAIRNCFAVVVVASGGPHV